MIEVVNKYIVYSWCYIPKKNCSENMRSKIVKILSALQMLIVLSTVLRDEKGEGFRPESSFLFRRHFQIIASMCSLIKQVFEMASLCRCLKVHNIC